MNGEKTSTGLQPNVAALLSYLLGFVTGIIFLVIEKDNKFVRFHAMQSTVTFLPLFVGQIVIGYIPIIGMLSILIGLLSLVLWIILMIKAYQGEMFKLPIAGDIADNFLNKPTGQVQGTGATYTAAPQQPQAAQPKAQSKFCQSCGSPAKAVDRFCEKCGKQL